MINDITKYIDILYTQSLDDWKTNIFSNNWGFFIDDQITKLLYLKLKAYINDDKNVSLDKYKDLLDDLLKGYPNFFCNLIKILFYVDVPNYYQKINKLLNIDGGYYYQNYLNLLQIRVCNNKIRHIVLEKKIKYYKKNVVKTWNRNVAKNIQNKIITMIEKEIDTIYIHNNKS